MFAKGTLVYHRTSGRSGRVVECDGDTVYIVQDNGAELDLPGQDLTRRRSDQAGPAAAAAPLAAPRRLTARDMTPEHAAVLASIPARTQQAVAALYERQPGAGKFSGLDLAGKLNAVADITAVPYLVMRQHRGNPGELGLVMGKGLADRQRKA